MTMDDISYWYDRGHRYIVQYGRKNGTIGAEPAYNADDARQTASEFRVKEWWEIPRIQVNEEQQLELVPTIGRTYARDNV